MAQRLSERLGLLQAVGPGKSSCQLRKMPARPEPARVNGLRNHLSRVDQSCTAQESWAKCMDSGGGGDTWRDAGTTQTGDPEQGFLELSAVVSQCLCLPAPGSSHESRSQSGTCILAGSTGTAGAGNLCWVGIESECQAFSVGVEGGFCQCKMHWVRGPGQ